MKRSSSVAGHVAPQNPVSNVAPSTPNRSSVVGYIRVSSKGQNYDSQRHAIERLATAHGVVVSEWYAEKKSASKTLKRPELDRLREDAAAGRIGRLYFFALDRLTRTGILDTHVVLQELLARSVEVVSVTEQWLTPDNPCADLIVSVMAWCGQQENRRRAERIAAAREEMEARGEPWGRPPSMTAAQRDTALRMKGEGRSIRDIAQALGIHRSSVGRFLQRAA